MYNSHVLEKDSCYDPETDEAVVILDALVSGRCPSTVRKLKYNVLAVHGNCRKGSVFCCLSLG